MLYSELLKKAVDYLITKNVGKTARLDAEILICEAANITREKLLAILNEPVDEKIISDYRKLIKQRALSKMPIAYLTNSKEFYGYDFFITKDCLIPRPETEQIIDEIKKDFSDNLAKLNILDICSGSGNILISLLNEYKYAEGIAVDISKSALFISFQNACVYRLLNRIDFYQTNILDFTKLNELLNLNDFDIIVSNPPYITREEYNTLSDEVLNEPQNALLVNADNPIIFYETIIKALINQNPKTKKKKKSFILKFLILMFLYLKIC